MVKALSVSIILLLVNISCSHHEKKSEGKKDINSQGSLAASKGVQTAIPKGMITDTLSKIDAEKRSARISNAKYDLFFKVEQNSENFLGRTMISFENSSRSDLRLDFQGGQVLSLSVNSKVVFSKLPEIEGSTGLLIPGESLKAGANIIEVEYQHAFSHQGTGLHRYVDPKDKRVYIYSHSEPNDASRFFPCFDQPDIKGLFSLKVEAPKSWIVVTNAPEKSKTHLKGGTLWTFEESPKMSTYLFALMTGQYHVWNSRSGKIPLRLLARESMASYVNPSEWFDLTKHGLQFFPRYYSYPYPFKKYDQIIVPEFNSGAMENIGAVTFNEHYLVRGTKTVLQRSRLADTLLHEMAHMWFGDLVTMKWWDDLWLNESFATLMAAKASFELKDFKTSWVDFHNGAKAWAYGTDLLSTTHPIQSNLQNTDEVGGYFDGITYGKGGAVLKQLAFYVGEENFRKGLKNYFEKFAFKNATLEDFIESMAASSPHDLTGWKQAWLLTTRPDRIRADFSCVNNHLESLEISIHSSSPHVPKTHAFELAVLKKKGDTTQVVDRLVVRANRSQKLTHQAKTDTPCPDAVFPNYDDQGYFLVDLDLATLTFAKMHVSSIKDPLLRTMFWNTLWQMVRDQKLTVQSYAQIALQNLPLETNPEVRLKIIRTLSGGTYYAANNVLHYWPTDEANSKASREQIAKAIEDLYWKQVQVSKPGSDSQQTWLDSYITAATTPGAALTLAQWVRGEIKLKGLSPNQDRRWSALIKLCHLGVQDSMALVNQELKADTSDRGKNSLIACEATSPNEELKKKWWDAVTAESSGYSFKELNSAMRNLFEPDHKPNYARRFAQDFFKFLEQKLKSKEGRFQEAFSEMMGPNDCTQTTRLLYEDYLSKNSHAFPMVVKTLKEVIDEDERCEKIRTRALTP